MSFNNSIPRVNDFLAISQKQMLANFQAINNAFNQNHVALTSKLVPGMHKSLTLRIQATDPTTGGGQCAVYNKFDANTVPQLFFRSNSNQTPVQLTNSNYNITSVQASTGVLARHYVSTFVAGPFTIYTGFILRPVSGTVITLLPSTTLKYVSAVTTKDPNFPDTPLIPQIMNAINVTANTFTLSSPAGSEYIPPFVYFLAIGQ